MPDRPIRDRFEKVTEGIPEGPLGKVGSGDVIGAGGFLAVESTRPFVDFIPGVKQPGYKIFAHSTDRVDDLHTEHNITVAGVSRNVAEFAAEYTAAPSNVDYLTSKTTITGVEEVSKKRSYSIWRITVNVEDARGLE